MPVNRQTDAYGGRFARDVSGGSVEAGYRQAVAKVDTAMIRRNLKPYKQYGLEQRLSVIRKETDQQRYDDAAAAVLKKFKKTRSSGGGNPGGGSGKAPTVKKPVAPKSRTPSKLPDRRAVARRKTAAENAARKARAAAAAAKAKAAAEAARRKAVANPPKQKPAPKPVVKKPTPPNIHGKPKPRPTQPGPRRD